MNAKKAIKKVVALGVGVSMLGATLLGATASPYDLSEYPAPFVVDGMFNGLMVVGDDAAPADIIGVTDVAMSLQFSSTVKETVQVSGEAGVMLGGDSVKIQRSGDVLELDEWIGDVVETFDASDAEALKTFTVSNSKGTTDVNQYLRFKWDSPTATTGAAKVLYTEDDDDNVGDFLWFDDGSEIFQYEMEFVEGFESDLDDGDTNRSLADLEDETLHILGEDFAVVNADFSSSQQLTLDLMGGAVHDTIEEGETKTYTLKGKEYEVTVLIISDWSGAQGSADVKLKVNGEVTKALNEGDTEILNDGTTIGIREVLPNEAGETAGGDILEFYLGAFKIQLEDSTGAADTFNGNIEVNEENIEDAELSMVFTSTTDSVRISKISYILSTDGVGGDEPYVAPGQGFREKLDEPEGMLADAWDIRYEGLSDPGVSEIKLKASGDDEYRLSFTSTQGVDYSNIRLFFGNGSSNLYYGDDDDAFIFGSSAGNASDESTYLVKKNDYFVLSHNGNTDTGVTRILRLDSIDTSNEIVQMTDVGSGSTINSQYTASCDLGAPGDCAGDINVGGYTFDFFVMNDSTHNVKMLVDHNDSNALSTAGTATEAKIVVHGGGIIDLGTPDATYRAATTTPITMTLTTLSKNFDESSGDEVISWNVTGGTTVDINVLESSTTVELFSPDYNDDLNIGMSDYGVLVKEEDEGTNDPDTLTIEYPLSQLLPQAFVTFEKTVTMEGGAGTITVERPQRIEIGSAVLASQVSDPSAANVVTVGGSCINSVTAEIMGLTYPACGADSGLAEGEGIVKLYESGDKVAIVVAGWEAEDTTRATRVLADYKMYQEAGQLVGTEVKVTGTSATEFTVTPVAE